jgi:hypothetical protein
MTEILDKARHAERLLRDVAAVDRSTLPEKQLCELLVAEEAANRMVRAAQAQTAAEIAERSRYELGSQGLSARHGQRKPVHFIEQHTRVSQAEASRRIRLGTKIRPRFTLGGEPLVPQYPHVAHALTEGLIGAESAAVIIRCLDQAQHGSDASIETLEAAELSMIGHAKTKSADLVSTFSLMWRERLDPDGAQPRYERILEQRSVVVGRERNGVTDVRIKSDPVGRALVTSLLAESTAPGAVPRFLSEDDRARGTETRETADGQVVTELRDPRTRDQRQHDILFGSLLAGARVGHSAAAPMHTTSRVTAVITIADLMNGTGSGWLEGGDEPIPTSVVKALLCDGEFRKLVLGTDGEVLAEGQLERFYSVAQRAALAVRDGGCVWPNCTAPPGSCHAHHVESRADGGPTDIDNGTNFECVPEKRPPN